MPLPYRSVKDIYDTLHQAGAVSDSLPDWSTEMNQLTDSDLYSAGQHDNFVKRASVGLDRILEATGIPNLTAQGGRAVGNLVGAPDVGERIGHSIPRMGANFLPLLAGPWGLAGVAALSGADTYTETGSPAAGILSGATNALMPGVASKAEQFALKKIGGSFLSGPISDALGNVSQVSRYFPKNLGQGLVAELAGQAGAAGLGEASSYGQDYLQGQPLHNPFTVENLLNLTLGQAPFAALHLTEGGRAKFGGEATRKVESDVRANMERTQALLDQADALRKAKEANPLGGIPDYSQPVSTDPKTIAEHSFLLGKLRQEKQQLAAEATPESMDEWNKRSQDEQRIIDAQRELTGGKDTVGGEALTPDAERFNVVGTTHFVDPERAGVGYRIIRAADDPANADQGIKPGELISYSMLHEPGPKGDPLGAGNEVYSVPSRFHTRNVVDHYAEANQKLIDEQAVRQQQNPELPVQEIPKDLGQFRAQQAKLSDLQGKLDKVSNEEELRGVIVDYNNARIEAGYPPLDDAKLEEIRSMFGAKDVSSAVRSSMTKLMRKLEAKRVEQEKSDALMASIMQPREDALSTNEVKDEEGVALANDVHGILAGSGLAPEHFNRLLLNWDAGGRQGGVQGLADLVSTAKRTGKGKRKGDSMLAKIEEAATSNVPEAEPIKDIRSEMANAIAHKLGGEEPGLWKDLANWVDWVESGTKELPNTLKDNVNIEDWNDQLRQYLEMAKERNVLKSKSSEEGIPFKPTDPDTLNKMLEWQLHKGGEGITSKISASDIPEHAALAKALSQYPELLKRIQLQFQNISGSAFAAPRVDGGILIAVDPGVLYADPRTREQVMLHELLHGLTKMQVNEPTNAKFVDQLTQLREQVANSLPKADKAAYDKAVKEGWMEKWLKDEVTGKDLHEDPRVRSILYGLLDNEELITQGFTSPHMRKYLQSVKVERNQTAWQRFAGWVKSLLGVGEERVTGTAFEQLLNHTSGILDQGEYVASTRNYLDRFFQNKGYYGEELNDKTNRAIGLLLSARDGNPAYVVLNMFQGGEIASEALHRATQNAEAMFEAKNFISDNANQTLKELGHPEGMDGLDSIVINAAIKNESGLRETLEMLPSEASKYIFEKWNDIKDVFDAAKGAASKEVSGLVNLVDPKLVREHLLPVTKELDKLVKLQKEHEDAEVEMSSLTSINPNGWLQKALQGQSKSIDEIKKMVDPDSEKNKFLNFVERGLSLPAQIARQDPRAAEFVAKMIQRAANARKMTTEALKVFATDDISNTINKANDLGVTIPPSQMGGQLSHDSLERSLVVLKNPKLTKAINEWIFENQNRNPGAEVVLPMTDDGVKKILSSLTPEEKTQVNEHMQKMVVSKQSQDAQLVEKMQQVSSTAAVKVLGRVGREFGLNLSSSDRLSLASNLLDAALTNFNDPMAAQAANVKIQQVGAKLPLEVFNQLLKFTQVEADKIKTIRDNMATRPGWVSGQDYGRYRIVWLDAKQEPHRWSGNDKSEATAVAKKASKVVEFADRGNQDNDDIHYPSMTPELIERIRQLEENSMDIQGLSAQERELARQSSVATQIEREAGAQGVPGVVSPSRRQSRGAQDLPWAENHFSWVTSSSNGWTRRLLKAQYETHMSEPEVQASDEYKGWVKDYFEGYMRSDPELAKNIRKFTSLWFLGGNMASAIANPIGNGMRMISELTNVTGKPMKSYSRFLKAASEVAGNFRGKGKWANPEHEQLMKDAANEGMIAPTLYDEDAAAQEAVSTRYKQVIEGQKPQTLAQRLNNVAGHFTQVAMWPFRMGEMWNSQVAILSAYDMYREQGLSPTDAKAKAFEFNGSVNDSGGRANRPVAPFSAQGTVPRSAALISTAMQNYVLGSTFQLIRYLKSGAFRPSGLTPHEVWSARKAAVQMLSMQFAAAGTLGLPFVSGALALLDKAFPELELNKKLRETMHDFFDGDQRSGNTLSDMALTGVPSMFGWDMQSRLSMGNTVPGVSEVNGFDPTQLLGPPVALVSQFVKGGQRLISGQGSVADLTPPSVKKLVQLISSGGSSVNDYKGRPVLNDLTAGEKLGIGLGFQPKRLSDYNAASRITDQQSRVAASQENQFLQNLATESLKGNFGSTRLSLLQRAQEDKNYDPVSAVRSVAKKAEELTFPPDLRREGSLSTSPERARVLAAFGLGNSQPNEVARWQLRTSIEQKLGVNSADVAGFKKAQLMDQLSQQHPGLTRAELSRMVEVATRHSPSQQMLSQPQGFQ